jgi:hypothetical protein
MNISAQEFLEIIFGNALGWLCLAHIHDIGNPDKTKKGYEEIFYKWPNENSEVMDWIEKHSHADCYFCPHLLSQARRRKQFALPGQVLYADLDECGPARLNKHGEPSPSMIVETSPQRWQAYWLLEAPVEPQEYEKLNHQIAYAYKDEGADQGGWDLTQLLRVPGTMHCKRKPVEVKAWLINKNCIPTYSPEQFEVLPHFNEVEITPEQLNVGDMSYHRSLDTLWGKDLRLWNRRVQVGQRSEHIYKLIRLLKEKLGFGDGLIVKTLLQHPVVTDKWPNLQNRIADIKRCLNKIKEEKHNE